jgi:multisubunit Na+/H+ antiporter MnhF subunit
MTAWTIAVLALFLPLAAAGWGCARGKTEDRLVALMFAGEVATLILLALAAATHRGFYVDCALAAAILPYPSSIVFAQFYEKWV